MTMVIDGNSGLTMPGGQTQTGALTLGTAQNSTSGTSIDFAGIPSWAKRVTVVFNEVSLSGTDNFLVQLGTSGGLDITGYISTGGTFSSAATATTSVTNGMVIRIAIAAFAFSGSMQLTLIGSNLWVASYAGKCDANLLSIGGGSKTLLSALTTVSITRTGTNTFDGGSINILYE